MKEEDHQLSQDELKALVTLLDDQDAEVISHVESKILSLGNDIIPFLETQWEQNLNPLTQKRIEDLIHVLQFEHLKKELQVWRESEAQDLLKGVWLISLYQYPDSDFSKIQAALEQFYYEVWLDFKTDVHAIDQIKLLNSVFFNKLKFAPNTKNFHSPGNSMINVVLESRKGNPISLSVVYMLIAQRLKLPVYGVNLPNIFVMTYKGKDLQFYINTFNRGLIISKSDIENYLSNLNMVPKDAFFEPCSNLDIVRRILRNLIMSFEKVGEHQKVDEIKQLLYVITDGYDDGSDI